MSKEGKAAPYVNRQHRMYVSEKAVQHTDIYEQAEIEGTFGLSTVFTRFRMTWVTNSWQPNW